MKVLSILFSMLVYSSLYSAIIFEDGFENAFPDIWTLTSSNSSYNWGDNNYRYSTGSWSAFCADNGSSNAHAYPNSITTMMEKRNVDLRYYSDVNLWFDYYGQTETNYDKLTVYIRDQSATWHLLFTWSGSTPAWQTKSINLNSYIGQSGVYIQFRFDSDISNTSEGVWLDNVILTGTPVTPIGLVAYWHFDEGSGSIAYDAIGSNNGTITGAVWADGYSGKALQFSDGSGVKINKPFNGIQNTFSIECWIYINSWNNTYGSYMTVFRNRGDYRDIQLCFSTYNGAPKTLRFNIDDTNGNTHSLVSTTVFNLSQWYHVLATYNGSIQKLYVNNVLEASQSGTFSVPWNVNYRSTDIGDNSYDTGYEYSFRGIIDEFKIYNSDRSAIDDIFNPPVQSNFNISINPNPFSSKADISFMLPSVDKSSVFITDLGGNTVKEFTGFSKGRNSLSFEVPAGLKQGIYFLNIKSGNYSETKQLINLK